MTMYECETPPGRYPCRSILQIKTQAREHALINNKKEIVLKMLKE